MKVRDILNILDSWAPFETAESFDNTGLLVGDGDADVSGILIALDADINVIEEAKMLGANLIVTHHPVIFNAMKDMTYDTDQGKRCQLLAQHGISVISAHTNLDMADGGISDVMAEMLGLENVAKPQSTSLLRVGELPEALDVMEFATLIKSVFGSKRVMTAGRPPDRIRKVCVLGGSGGDFIMHAKSTGADVYLLGEAKHENAIASMTLGVFMMTAGHYETESVILPKILACLQKHAYDVQSVNGINISKSGVNPFDIMD